MCILLVFTAFQEHLSHYNTTLELWIFDPAHEGWTGGGEGQDLG